MAVRSKVWMPAVNSFMKRYKRPLTYEYIMANAQCLSIFPRKMVGQMRNKPSRYSFYKAMKLEGYDTFIDSDGFRYFQRVG